MNDQKDLTWVHVTQMPDYSGRLDKTFLGLLTQAQSTALGGAVAIWMAFFVLFINILSHYIGKVIPGILMVLITIGLAVAWWYVFFQAHYDFDQRLMYYNDTRIMMKRRYEAGEEYGRYINKLEDHGPEYITHDHWR